MFSKCIKIEYPELDVMVLNPNEVSTAMIGNRRPDFLTITA